MSDRLSSSTPLALCEAQAAALLDVSIHFLKKDRRTKRLIPFYKIGRHVRYNPVRIQEALTKLEEGGANQQRRKRPILLNQETKFLGGA